MPRLPRVHASCGHYSYVRNGQKVCTFCQWSDPVKRARARYRDIVKGWKRGRRWPMRVSLDEFQRWYCEEVARADACHYCRISRDELREEGSNLCSWHIDRMDSSRPYEQGNLAIACARCNIWKGAHHTYDQTLLWAGHRMVAPQLAVS